MDQKEREGERTITKIKVTLQSIEDDNTKPLVEKEKLRNLWEAELLKQEERLYQYRLQKQLDAEERKKNVLPFKRR